MLELHGNALIHIGNMLGILQSWSILPHLKQVPSFPTNFSIQLPNVSGNHTINVNQVPDNDSGVKEESKKAAQEMLTEMLPWFEKLQRLCTNMSLTLSVKLTARVIDDLKRDGITDSFGTVCRELYERIQDELSEIYLLQMDKHAKLYNERFPFGEKVADKSPSSAEDCQEAANCLALERWTACVFHLMRVMEIGVQKFGDKIGVTLTGEKNWQIILDQVNKAIKGMDQKAQETKEYAALAAHLYNVKIAWRNEVMHPKATYTPQEAEEIYQHVGTFLGRLVQIM